MTRAAHVVAETALVGTEGARADECQARNKLSPTTAAATKTLFGERGCAPGNAQSMKYTARYSTSGGVGLVSACEPGAQQTPSARTTLLFGVPLPPFPSLPTCLLSPSSH